jgi:hypothetical protein
MSESKDDVKHEDKSADKSHDFFTRVLAGLGKSKSKRKKVNNYLKVVASKKEKAPKEEPAPKPKKEPKPEKPVPKSSKPKNVNKYLATLLGDDVPELKSAVASPTIARTKRTISHTPAHPKSTPSTPTPVRPSAPKLARVFIDPAERRKGTTITTADDDTLRYVGKNHSPKFDPLESDFVWEDDWNPDFALQQASSGRKLHSDLQSIREEIKKFDNDDDPSSLANIKRRLYPEKDKPKSKDIPYPRATSWVGNKNPKEPIIVLRPTNKDTDPVYIRGFNGAADVAAYGLKKQNPHAKSIMNSVFSQGKVLHLGGKVFQVEKYEQQYGSYRGALPEADRKQLEQFAKTDSDVVGSDPNVLAAIGQTGEKLDQDDIDDLSPIEHEHQPSQPQPVPISQPQPQPQTPGPQPHSAPIPQTNPEPEVADAELSALMSTGLV